MHPPPPIPLVTLTTDFGTSDGYTGAMKGVIQSVAPHTRTVDITHEIPAGDIRSGAWALRTALPFFPRGTVHVAVIDPGVGTDRHALIVLADHQYLIGPDNGLFSWILEESTHVKAWKLSDDSWSPIAGSHTFHGRDLFSHAAALMVREADLERVIGEEVEPVKEEWARAVPVGEGAIGEVVHIDHFGNVITNLVLPEDADPGQTIQVKTGSSVFEGLNRTYGDVDEGKGLLLVGSHNFLEIAVRQGSAAQQFGLARGDQVTVQF
jgi:S-adenosylmethionine hydrolase